MTIPKRGRKRKGFKYEEKGHREFTKRYGFQNYFPSVWFEYNTEGNYRNFYCQTDGLLFNTKQKNILIFEFKLKHTAEAFFQVENKYVPVVRKVFPEYKIKVCEVVHWFDPITHFPVKVTLTKDPTKLKTNQFGVHIFR